jgi:N-acetyl-anhydromuramyl-L-alanine amidase AmpD
MTLTSDFQRALTAALGDKVVFQKDWKTRRRGPWRGYTGRPDALMLHHTAAAATESTDPRAEGNQKGANDNVIRYIQSHYEVPAANFTLDRDGTVYVHSVWPVWHAGKGSFKLKKPWSTFSIPDDMGNDYLLGVEIMSKGRKKDFTKAQKESLAALQEACGVAARWPVDKRTATVRHPRHKDWTERKIDILYTNDEVNGWMG